MKRAISFLLIVGFGALVFACTHEDRLRYRVTYAFDTSQGEKSGSHVIEIWRAMGSGAAIGGGTIFRFRGEAAAIEVAPGKMVFAILALGPKGDFVDGPLYLPGEVYAKEVEAQCKQRRAAAQGYVACMILDADTSAFPPKELTLEQTPVLVAFTDINDPASARLVRAQTFDGPDLMIDAIAELFGPGIRFKRAVLEIVPAGIWPFSRTGLSFPQFLTGVPVTREIEERLPLLVSHREKLWWQRTAPSDPYIPQFHNFIRE
jgi:hypothetical protein